MIPKTSNIFYIDQITPTKFSHLITSRALSQPHNAQGKRLQKFRNCELNGMAKPMTACKFPLTLRSNDMSISNLKKSEIFANVDGNRPASSRQLYAVARHFGKVGGNDQGESYRLQKIYSAILLKFQNEHTETPITHSDVSRFFESSEVPPKFVKMINTKPVKAKKIIKDTPKAKKATPKVTSVKKIQADTSALSEFQARFDAITKRQDATDKKLSTFEAKLDIIMAYLETDPDA